MTAVAERINRSADYVLSVHQRGRGAVCTRLGCGSWPCLPARLAEQAKAAARRTHATLTELVAWGPKLAPWERP